MGRVAVFTGEGSRTGLAVGRRLDPPEDVLPLLQFLYWLIMVSFSVEIWWQRYLSDNVTHLLGLRGEAVP